GLDTSVGKEFEESGVSFSGGEKQKIAIARAIYKDAPFVIMDEPTAALDPESECEVYEGFDKMVGNKTAIYISHRLASCRFCQDILVFDKGRAVQRGTHEELEKQDGLYKQLWDAQAQYYA
ncbi:MAG: ABC transporter ATP-binding protein/permease, partial [Lachnospiraceae bacterium]|nr:ABC transporter ATP-binding protein/permease [Lachnospiraceae bacterium]